VWWAIAKVRLRDQPAALEALGVELAALRRKGGKKAAGETGTTIVPA
jgi:hypothetical protein